MSVCLKDSQIRQITQRLHKAEIDCFGERKRNDIVVIFDKIDDDIDGSVANGFKCFLFKHEEGKQCKNILEMPLFVASINTPLIRFPDFAGNILREFYNHKLDKNPPSNQYEEWLNNLGTRIKAKSMDFRNGGYTNFGIYQMGKEKFMRHPR